MFKPYRTIEDGEQHALYQFKTGYLYAMYVFLALALFGWLIDVTALMIGGVVLMGIYFAIVSTQYVGLNKTIKDATRESSVEYTGSKWSFSQPLTVKVKKDAS